MKDLILKFGYTSITELGKEKGWSLPTSDELKGFDSHHRVVWTSDPMLDEGEEFPERYAMLYDYKTGKTEKCHKNFKQNIVVKGK